MQLPYFGRGDMRRLTAPLPAKMARPHRVWLFLLYFVLGLFGLVYGSFAKAAQEANKTISNQAQVSYKANNGTVPVNDISGTVMATVTASLPPKIVVQKVASLPEPVAGQDDTFDITYTIKISNTGTVAANYIHLADNLSCTFKDFENPAPLAAWHVIGKPKVTEGNLVVDPNYTGKAPCSSSDVETFDPNKNVQLVDGSKALLPAESATLQLTVRVTLAATLDRLQQNFNNTVYAVSLLQPNTGSGNVVAASASAAQVASKVMAFKPTGVVYNSNTRKPVKDAVVTLVRVNSASCPAPIREKELYNPFKISYALNADGSVSMTTGADGSYSFFFDTPQKCTYKLNVTPPAQSGLVSPSIKIPATPGTAPKGAVQNQAQAPIGKQDTTYYLTLALSNNSDVWHNHIPLDPADEQLDPHIFLNKDSTKTIAEIGDIVPYTLSMTNVTPMTLDNVQVRDVLPRGFRLIPGSVRLRARTDAGEGNWRILPDPQGSPGAPLDFNVAGLNWPVKGVIELSYQLQVGVGSALDKSNVNRAQAQSGRFTSNQSSWAITVTGGVFSDDAFLVGKVYLEDCKADKEQKDSEVGIPGVRLLMEDGTSVVTDVEGKYSLYGLSPITHVLKLDKATLPPDAKLVPLSNRNSGKGDSRFVDLKKGELHKADFAVDGCKADALVDAVLQRREALETQPNQDGQALLAQRFNAQYGQNPIVDPKALPASGIITPMGPQTLNNLNNGTTGNGGSQNSLFQSLFPASAPPSLASQRLQAAAPNRPSVIPLENVMKNLDNTAAFIGLNDNDTLPNNITNIRVKGLAGSVLRLKINGQEIPATQVGKKAILADKQLEAWEYIGVGLRAGKNTVLLEVADAFGNVRASKAINLIAPGEAGAIHIKAPTTATADNKTAVKITLHLTDDNGVPVSVRTPVTVESNHGTWLTQDLDSAEPGLQIFMEGGQAEVSLLPPGEPADALIKVTASNLQDQVKLAFLPDLRPLVGAGILEGVVNFKAGQVNVNAPSAYDAFERELRNISVNSGDMRASGRAAFFFKGTVKGKYLLTAAYDSDKKTKERLFRDIQPDKFYPIYGDSSIKGFDGQSTQRIYLRVDKEKSYLMYGDFTTSDGSPDRKLSQYSRSATGLRGHYENDRVSVSGWVSHDSLAQKIVEIPANGTSGPYKVPGMEKLYENSEKVEILVRDRNQPTIILESLPMSRFADYSVDWVTKELFFKGPVASLDANLNPRTIRITYESVQGGEGFFKGGADGRMKVGKNIELGASYARDDNPEQKTAVMGGSATVKLGEKTTLVGEVARTHTGKNNANSTGGSFNNGSFNNQTILGTGLNTPGYINQNISKLEGDGWAERLELRHEGSDLKANAQVTHADKNFNNPTSGFSNGRTEATAKLKYKLNERASLVGEGIYSKDHYNGGMRAGILAGIEYAFDELISAQFGMRAVHQDLANSQQNLAGGFNNLQGNALVGQPNNLLTVRGKLMAKLPWIPGADVYGEAEQDIFDMDKHMFAVGVGYLVNDQTRVYGRYEFISSLNSPYALTSTQQNNQAVIGVESAYSKNGRLFSEYRIRDAINGREAQAAMGLRHTWDVAQGLRLGGSFETTHAFAGQPGSNSTAVTGLAEYIGDPRYKLTGSLEARFASSGNSWMNTLGLAYKINPNWSLLARNGLSIQENASDGSALWRTRQQVGVAWRQVDDNRWHALGRYEHRLEEQQGGKDPYRERSHILSTHVNYQPRRDLIASGRYAVKWSDNNRKDIKAKALTQLIYGRATWDFYKDFDVSLQSGAFFNEESIQFSHGVELGYQVVNDLWASAGYNIQGFDGGDLKGTDYTAQGFYVRVRFKFDEGLFN